MRIFDLFCFKYNRTDFHELNLDWIISDLRTLAETLQNFISLNTIKYANPIQWNITTQYESNTVVVDPNTGTAYLSVQPVPSGVLLANTDYWTPIFTLNLLSANQNITLRDDGSNTLATFTSAVDDWLIWNGTLYKVTQAINLNEAYVPGYNITRYTVELFLNDAVSTINTEITNIQNQINDMNDGSVVGSLQNQINTNAANISTNTTNISANATNILRTSLNPKDFGASCDQNIDDSTAVQDMFDYAASHLIRSINFHDITEISFKNVEIKSDVYIDFGECKFYGVALNDMRIYTMFTVNDPDVDVVIDGGEFIGYGGNTPSTNANVLANPPLIDVTTANSIKIINSYFHNINNTNEGVTSTTPFVDRCGCLFRIHDCKFTSVCNNLIDKCYASELMWIINNTYGRNVVNMEFKSNVIVDIATTCLDFVGASIEISGNVYNYDYQGSVINAFGLNVNIHDEIINGIFVNAYDNCENTLFQGENFKVDNITVKQVRDFVIAAAKNIEISNISILEDYTASNSPSVIGRINSGYNGDNVHPDIGTSEIDNVIMKINNCNLSHLTNAYFALMSYVATKPALIDIESCVSPNIPNTDTNRKSGLVYAQNANVKLQNCILYTSLKVQYSSVNSSLISNYSPFNINNLIISDCDIINNFANDAYLVSGAGLTNNMTVVGCIAESTPTVHYSVSGAVTNEDEAANINIVA